MAKRLGSTKFRLNELENGAQKEVTHMLEGKDHKNVGSCTIKVLYHKFSKDEQQVAFEEEKRILKEGGVKRSMKVAINRAFPSVGYRVGRVRKVGSGLSKAGKLIGNTLTQGIPTKVVPQLTE
ncbi:uncharacterized protein LOC120135950 [Hibiscus syriacus]|uniref:uncharacterized protein LOC120135950 n=1 Tax=Hibiscus syriacus TaxID=106335 RepID=UPI0019214B17|nr:uncharacterized protein LOC120135950 [Hibiscus syriacus]